ncbi:MAG: cation:proton antiporter [Coriobacteriales bacterium]
MAIDFVSLAVIALVSALVPIIARLIPGRPIPETVFLLFIGAALGPSVLGILSIDETISFLSELGVAFLFLLAGFEIEPRNLARTQGKHALGTWLVSFGIALGLVFVAGIGLENQLEGLAVAIALTSTALGTLMPILKERGLMGTRLGNTIISFGTWGELGPVLAMALLLSSRSALASAIIMLALLLLCIGVGVLGKRFRSYSGRIFDFIVEGSQTTSQTYVRLTVLLLVSMVALSAIFDLDIVLGAFAAGFVLRSIVPEENETLELKLNGMAHGFFIPLFFIVSGVKIDLSAVVAKPLMLVGFIALLMFVRFLPILVDLRICPESRDMAWGDRVSVALYCTTALPIIVAVTSLAVGAGAMQEQTASVLVCAGAVTVLIMPLLAMVAQRTGDAKPVEAVTEIVQEPSRAGDILRNHVALSRLMATERKEEEKQLLERAVERRSQRRKMTLEAAGEAAQMHREINRALLEQVQAVHAADHERVAQEFQELREKARKDRNLPRDPDKV